MISAVGNDGAGEQLLAASRKMGIDVGHVVPLPGRRTATFTALLDGSGELVGAIADMAVLDDISPEIISAASAEFADADLVVCDANLPAEALEQIIVCCAAVSVPVWFEPVSVGKALKGRCLEPWHLITPNWDELLVLLDHSPAPLPDSGDESRLPEIALDVIGEITISSLADHVLVTMGSRGAVLASASHSPTIGKKVKGIYDLPMATLLAGIDGAPTDIPNLALLVEGLSGEGGPLWYRLLRPLEGLVDSTGAGDALVAGTAFAYASGWPLEQAVLSGLLCAHLTLFVHGAVAHFFDQGLLGRLRQAAKLDDVAAGVASRL